MAEAHLIEVMDGEGVAHCPLKVAVVQDELMQEAMAELRASLAVTAEVEAHLLVVEHGIDYEIVRYLVKEAEGELSLSLE